MITFTESRGEGRTYKYSFYGQPTLGYNEMSSCCPFYFAFSETPTVLAGLDKWTRRRLRCFIWKQWKSGHRRYVEAGGRGMSETNWLHQTAGSN